MKVVVNPGSSDNSDSSDEMDIDFATRRYPFCLVWTPIPIITWVLPFVGHMGIATSRGVIRDFAGSYFVSEDDMAFGWPTRYVRLDVGNVNGGADAWDRAVRDASDEYKSHTHNLCCDNCHSHVALALNEMGYNRRHNYNMFYLAALMLFCGRFTGFGGFVKQWLPFAVIVVFAISILIVSSV